jgi:hypothetical protein
VYGHIYGTVTDIVRTSDDETSIKTIWGQAKLDYYANDKMLKGLIQGPTETTMTATTYTYESHGPTLLIIVPGYGPAYGIAGHLFYQETYDPVTGELLDVVFYIHGLEVTDWTPVCEYLAP